MSKKSPTLKAVNRIIDSVWTLEFRFVGPKKSATHIEIVKYSREDPEGYTRENELPACRKSEDAERFIRSVVIGHRPGPGRTVEGTEYLASNPKHVFDYTGE